MVVPTRPHPMITTCTALTLHGGLGPYSCRVRSLGDIGKSVFIGRPLRSTQPGETLLPKRLALPVFASDALSSVAYATEEILLVLTIGGTAFLHLSPWVAGAVIVLMIAVV